MGYYYSDTDLLCKQCDPLCASCITSPTYCSSCATTAYYISEQHQCVISCPDNYAPDSQKVCQTCKSLGQYYSSSKCVSQCPTNEYPDTYNTCGACSKLLYKNVCYDTCPNGTFTDTVNKTCYSCSDRKQLNYNNTCVSECPTGFIVQNGSCQSCATKNMYVYNNTCVQDCPTGTISDSSLNICNEETQSEDEQMLLTSFDSTRLVCSSTLCENGGTCSISFNNIQCTCSDKYIGSKCQYDVATFDSNQYIGK
jgi:proprotein convertase subtilisin/kexin type 5